MNCPLQHWNPRAPEVLADQARAYDRMRQKHPVAYSDFLGWSVFTYADVLHILEDHERFGNTVSRHRSVPNGLDPPEHTAYRRLIEPLLTQARLRAFAPVCRQIATGFAARLAGAEGERDFVGEFGIGYSLDCQCRFVGWPTELAAPIADWAERNRTASLAGDREALAAIAAEFRHCVHRSLAARASTPPDAGADDVITYLLQSRSDGAPLDHDDIASILRNWTVGELGSLAAGLSTIVYQLAQDEKLQDRLRADASLIPSAIEEILRAEGPLVCNRRIAKSDVQLGKYHIKAGERISLMWISANRDAAAFERADEIDPDRDSGKSLLYGAGIHYCPGASLARMEMRIAVEALLDHSQRLRLGRRPPLRAVFPANGYRQLHVRLD